MFDALTIAPAQAAAPAKAARGGRFYRSSFGRIAGLLDGAGVIVLLALVAHTTYGGLVDLPLRMLLPFVACALVLWAVLREHDLYTFPAEASTVRQGLKAAGALAFGWPLAAAAALATGVMLGAPVGTATRDALSAASALSGSLLIAHLVWRAPVSFR
jgi:hypothetical protein